MMMPVLGYSIRHPVGAVVYSPVGDGGTLKRE